MWTGITEGASDVYDNTVVQILGDEHKQEDKEENHNDKNNEEEKNKSESTHKNKICPPKVAKNTNKDKEDSETTDVFKQQQAIQSAIQSNDTKWQATQHDLSLIQAARTVLYLTIKPMQQKKKKTRLVLYINIIKAEKPSLFPSVKILKLKIQYFKSLLYCIFRLKNNFR